MNTTVTNPFEAFAEECYPYLNPSKTEDGAYKNKILDSLATTWRTAQAEPPRTFEDYCKEDMPEILNDFKKCRDEVDCYNSRKVQRHWFCWQRSQKSVK